MIDAWLSLLNLTGEYAAHLSYAAYELFGLALPFYPDL